MKARELRTQPEILAGSYSQDFADQVAHHLGLKLGKVAMTQFANTEIKAEVPSVRGNDVFVIQSHGAPVNEAIMEQAAIINAARRASARDITAVMPYRGYGRADKPDNSHESYMGPLTMRLFESAGANRIIEVDPHAGQSAGFLRSTSTEYTAIPSSPAIQEHIQKTILDPFGDEDVVIVSPDSGRAKLNRLYAQHFNLPRAIVDKVRTGTNQAEVSEVVGKVKDLRCIVIDDMVDTAGTLVQGAEALMDLGAKEVNFVATHGVLSDPAIERLTAAKRDGILASIAVTNTLNLPPETPDGLIDTISVAPLVGDAIRKVFQDESVSAMFK
ncbi:ribose-phosphate pyrophosphokinase [Candidatus Saccharibacteria bacterium]|nr:MAG: ribose-phosphate pyrophosphokinase [Candidatus Saccharibacteria bacterium]